MQQLTCLWRNFNGTIMDEIIYSNDFCNVIFIYRILFAGSAISGLIAFIIFVFFVKQQLGKKEFA
ncbi:hypothetical protein BCJMU51_2246 [Bacillus cereus]|nr:hypothetical protein A3782_10055 [Bacillus sp. GZT]BCB37361.1 hypothetical protein BCM0045_2256 [Bacillus cereus]BCC00182.1 hypothetical protein BCM0057_2264 [Bacillus cereus]BCC23687.1 hypothetical protein BCM0079_2280 [Bacillus cereus]BCC35285.1 hypothetical protein BCM0105_2275 [Bacillus cereus]